jgi:hypothetical protein
MKRYLLATLKLHLASIFVCPSFFIFSFSKENYSRQEQKIMKFCYKWKALKTKNTCSANWTKIKFRIDGAFAWIEDARVRLRMEELLLVRQLEPEPRMARIARMQRLAQTTRLRSKRKWVGRVNTILIERYLKYLIFILSYLSKVYFKPLFKN